MGTELENTGGIVNTLNIEFGKINSPFRVSPMLIVEGDKKVAEIDLDAKGKPSAINFWRYGVSLATASTTNIRDLAEVIDFWLAHDVTTHELAERYRFVYPTDNAKAFDEGTEVEYAWNSLAQNDRLEINEFVKLASKDEILSTLFPLQVYIRYA